MNRSPEIIFGILVREYELGLLAYVSAHVSDSAAAADIVQETFLAVWRQLDRIDPRYAFSTYLRGIARHKIADFHRKLYAERRVLNSWAAQNGGVVDAEYHRLVPEDGDLFDSRLAALRACLEKLNPPVRDIVSRHYLSNEPCSAIAAAMNRQVEAIKKLLQRARATLFECIQARFRSEARDV